MGTSIHFGIPMALEKILQAAVWQENKDFVALCLNNNVSSFGKNKEEALKNLKEALILYEEDSDVETSQIQNAEIATLTI